MGGGRLGLEGGFGWALRRGAGVAGSGGGGQPAWRQEPAQPGFRPKQGASAGGLRLEGGRGKGSSGVPTGIREQGQPAPRGAGSRTGDRKYAAERQELRMSVERRGASLGRPGGAVGVSFGGLDPSESAHFPRTRNGPRAGGGSWPRRKTHLRQPSRAGPGRAGSWRRPMFPGAG